MGGLEVPVGAPAAAPGPGLTAPVGGSPAASILMGLLARPEILQALFAMLMGGLGRGTVSAGAGGAQVPVAAIGQLLGQLGAQASAEFAAVNPAAAQVMPHYLMNSAGEFVVDPAISEQVAGHVLALFSESAPPAWPGTRARVAYIGRAPSVEESLVEIYDTLDRVGLTADVDSEYAFVGDDEADEAWWEVTADE
jgi:hypothetical protein